MAIRKIIRLGHPTLRQTAEPYPPSSIGSPEFDRLVSDMRETLHAAGGIGLAAPQIDVSTRVIVIEIANSDSRYGEIPVIPFTVFINPTVTVINPECAGFWEGCLSIPGMMGYVERPQLLTVEYLDTQAKPQKIEFEGFQATVFQHEFDHLNGTLYVDRITDLSLFSFDQEYQEFHKSESADQEV